MPPAAPAASRASRRTGPIHPLRQFLLGVEGGATRTTAVLAAADQSEVTQPLVLGPSNLRLLSDRELTWRLREIAERLPVVPGALLAVAIGLAGTRTAADRERIRSAAARVFPRVPCHATDDLETALATAPRHPRAGVRVLILSGTGSCCFGVAPDGRTAKVGGRGHIIGDRGSATDIGLRALRELVVEADRSGRWPTLGARILDALALNSPDDLIDWSMHAGKLEIASLAIPVFAAAAGRDPLARRILTVAAEALATDALACASRLCAPKHPVQFILNGAVLLKNPTFARQVGRRLRHRFPHAIITPLEKPSVWGAVQLARRLVNQESASPEGRTALPACPASHQPASHQPASQEGRTVLPACPPSHQPASHQPASHQPTSHQPTSHQPTSHQPASHQPASHQPTSHQPASHQPASHQPASHQPASHQPASHQPASHQSAAATRPLAPAVPPFPSLATLDDSPTERRNPRSTRLDTMPLAEAVDLMLDEESRVPAAIATERSAIVRVVNAVIVAFRSGGHLFYVGAGTSGRLGVLDASECPPTFRAPREQVQGIIAGGQQALWSAVEGAEDDTEAGAQSIRHRNVAAHDVVVGIAASGRTPFVWGALAEAGRRGATTSLICFNPSLKAAIMRRRGVFRPDVIIAPDLGPEVLTGSTRLKGGTATKQILNIVTTLAMSRVGKVISNLMIDLNPSNVKLRDRAQRILHELTGATPAEARAALEAAGWNVKQASDILRCKEMG